MGARREEDLLVLGRLEELGSDLTKPHKVDFFMYFPSEEGAESAAREIEKQGYTVKLLRMMPSWWKRFFDKPIWSCRATKTFVPDKETILETSASFDEIAQRFDGEYDGWGTELVK